MTDYVLRMSEDERERYVRMAEVARVQEADLWAAAGIAPGARVVDLGCGPGAVLVAMSQMVGVSGAVVGVDGDPAAVAAAEDLVAATGLANATVRLGDLADPGLEDGSFDVAVLRHVLAHNGRTEQALVERAAALVRPGGCVYLADIDITMFRSYPPDALYNEMWDCYRRFQAGRGNDCGTGLRLGALLSGAGLERVAYEGRLTILPAEPGRRGPPWAARHAMLDAGIVDAATIERWDAQLADRDAAPDRPTLFFPLLMAVGRRP